MSGPNPSKSDDPLAVPDRVPWPLQPVSVPWPLVTVLILLAWAIGL